MEAVAKQMMEVQLLSQAISAGRLITLKCPAKAAASMGTNTRKPAVALRAIPIAMVVIMPASI
jgi:hypothetical protein